MGESVDMEKIVIDLGASATRCDRVSKESGTRLSNISNRYVEIDMDEDVRLERINESPLSNLDVTIARITDRVQDVHFPRRVLLGEVAARYSSRSHKPHSLKAKHDQSINYYSILIALALQLRGVKRDLTNPEKVDLYLALPPVEVRDNKVIEKLGDILKDRFIVTFNIEPKVEIDIQIVKVKVIEESRLACISYSFNRDLTPTKLGKEIYEKQMTIMSVDVGASTTDIGIIKNGSYRENTGATVKRGGNFIEAELRVSVDKEYGFQPSVEDIALAVTTGRLKQGAKVLDVAKLLTDAKIKCAREMIADIEDYFTQQGMSPDSVEVMLVSGGGSMASYSNEDGKEVETTRPLTYFLEREIRKISDIRVEYISEDSGVSPREANINGLLLRARFDQQKESLELRVKS
jgi:hypothetical protein